jgi:hypothetical protein
LTKGYSNKNNLPATELNKKDWWYELSEAQKKQILAGLDNAEKEKLISSKEFWKRLKDA